jgi:hypothetical protein
VLLRRRAPREQANPEPADDAAPSLQELSEAYEERVSDAAGLVFAHLMSHPADIDLDLARAGADGPTLYSAVALSFPRLHDLGLTPTMWARATAVALAARREHALAAAGLADAVSEVAQ